MNSRTFLKIHCKILIVDFIQKHCMPLISSIFFVAAYATFSKTKKITRLMKSHRYSPNMLIAKVIKDHLPYIQNNARHLFDGDDSAGEAIQKTRAIVLKNPIFDRNNQCVEKGIYLITFTGTFQYYIKNINVAELQKFFYIVLEPSWAGYCLSEILWWSSLPAPVFIQATEIQDYNFLKSVSPNLIPLSFGASDWVNLDIFHPTEQQSEKKYDFVYVSNYNPIKRNYIYFKTLHKLRNIDFKAALVCSGWGDNRDYIFKLLKKFKLEDKVDIIERLPQDKLNELLNQSKVNILLSLKEGSNRSLFEGFFANTPGIILRDNIGANKSYFTAESGSIIDESQLSETLLWYKDNWRSRSARKWAMENISIHKTKEKLDLVIEMQSKIDKLVWTVGSELKINAPEAVYYIPENAKNYLSAEKILTLFDYKNEMGRCEAIKISSLCSHPTAYQS
jgi:glycosyltransferase involved in cell wall biosynthesis